MYIDLVEFVVIWLIAAVAVMAIAMLIYRHPHEAGWAAMIIATVAVVLAMIAYIPAACAEQPRECIVTGFDFRTAEVELTDADGQIWLCPFGKNDWELGEEYLLCGSNETGYDFIPKK